MKKVILPLLFLTMESIPLNMCAQDKLFSGYLSKAGMLSVILPESNAREITEMKLSGYMDARDFDYIKWYCTRIQTIDLSDIVIETYTGEDGTNEGFYDTYFANEIPTGAFYYWGKSKKHNYSGIPKNEGMSSITKITLPSSIKSIGRKAFADMPRLESITIMAIDPPKVYESSFSKLPKEAVLYVPKGTKARYSSAEGWLEFKKIVEINENGDIILTNSPLVGTWKTTIIEALGEKRKASETDYLQLKPDWTYIRVEEENGTPYVTKGTWTTSKDKFTLHKKDGDEEDISFNYEILELNSGKMKVIMLRIIEYMEKVQDKVILQYLKN